MHEGINSLENESVRNTEVPYTKNSHREELKNALSYLDIKVNDDNVNSDWVLTTRLDSCVKLSNRTVTENLMPNVKGMGVKDAVFILENLGLSVELQGRGTILKQSVAPGTRISKGDLVVIEMSIN